MPLEFTDRHRTLDHDEDTTLIVGKIQPVISSGDGEDRVVASSERVEGVCNLSGRKTQRLYGDGIFEVVKCLIARALRGSQ